MKALGSLMIAATFTMLSGQVAAQQDNKIHNVGLQVGGAGIEYKNKDSDGQGVGASYLYYNYQFMDGVYAEAGLLNAQDVDDWACIKTGERYECKTDEVKAKDFELEADNFKLNALVLALKGELKVSKRNSFYGKIGVSFYDYKLDVKRTKVADEDGTGLFLEAGWQYRWDNGIGFNLALQQHGMGDLDLGSFNLGVSYSF